MTPLIVFFCSLLFPDTSTSGYLIDGDNVIFFYSGRVGENVYVSGNFNSWSKNDTKWKLGFDEKSKGWKLVVPKKEIKALSGSFYEFTFRVDGVLVDAEKENKNVIHCQGYGYRYVINGL